MRRLLCLSETCILERDLASYAVVTIRPLSQIYCLVRFEDSPQQFSIEYSDGPRKTYLSTERQASNRFFFANSSTFYHLLKTSPPPPSLLLAPTANLLKNDLPPSSSPPPPPPKTSCAFILLIIPWYLGIICSLRCWTGSVQAEITTFMFESRRQYRDTVWFLIMHFWTRMRNHNWWRW